MCLCGKINFSVPLRWYQADFSKLGSYTSALNHGLFLNPRVMVRHASTPLSKIAHQPTLGYSWFDPAFAGRQALQGLAHFDYD
jgi:hypothetical protein